MANYINSKQIFRRSPHQSLSQLPRIKSRFPRAVCTRYRNLCMHDSAPSRCSPGKRHVSICPQIMTYFGCSRSCKVKSFRPVSFERLGVYQICNRKSLFELTSMSLDINKPDAAKASPPMKRESRVTLRSFTRCK